MIAILLASAGLCWALRVGKVRWLTDILLVFPFFDKMFQCAFCVGFHCGYGMYLLSGQWLGIPHWQTIGMGLVYGFSGATVSYWLDILEQNID